MMIRVVLCRINLRKSLGRGDVASLTTAHAAWATYLRDPCVTLEILLD